MIYAIAKNIICCNHAQHFASVSLGNYSLVKFFHRKVNQHVRKLDIRFNGAFRIPQI